jgi:Domain of unknown function (DUF4438)
VPINVVRHNGERLVLTRLAARVEPASANHVVDHVGRLLVRPGQGGVAPDIGLGDRADGWASDHLEPGASVGHPDPATNDAIGLLACVGNRATVLDGPAAGASGIVIGKHGAVIVALTADAAARLGPGEWLAIEARGVGLAIEDEPDLACHSCSPELLDALVVGHTSDGRLRIPVAIELPAEAAGAGIGMSVSRFNIDLQVDERPIADLARGLRFGDVVALRDHDHRWGRRYRRGWVAVGVIAHGHSVGGGHGLGMTTLLSGPLERLAIEPAPDANLIQLLGLERTGR